MKNPKSTKPSSSDPRSQLPSVSVLLEHPRVQRLIADSSRAFVLEAIRSVLEHYRRELSKALPSPSMEALLDAIEAALCTMESERLRPVINVTGILLHTGLGRAVLPQRAVDALSGLNRCCNLQIDLETGLRGKRNYMSEQLLCRLTGAEAAMVVNNNAAATLLVLASLCQGKEVVVSRGQLIEIGGAFRLPDCISQSGAKLVEVGTTNKTHLRDYENALSEQTGALLRVNPSNYRVVGFTKEVPIEELVGLKHKRDVLVIDDLGCGALVDLAHFGLPHEPTVQESIAAGADLALFSGDKLIGGPQAGIIVGKKPLIAAIKKHPLTRMLRVGKMTDLVLEQTLRLFLDPQSLVEQNPTLRMLTTPVEELKARAERLLKAATEAGCELELRVVESESQMGGGSLPDTTLKSYALSVESSHASAERLSALLRRNAPPVIARIEAGQVLLDMRTLLDEAEQAQLVEALVALKCGAAACGQC